MLDILSTYCSIVAFATMLCGVRRMIAWRSPRYRMAVATASYGGRHSIVWQSPHLFATPVELYEMACLCPSKPLDVLH